MDDMPAGLQRRNGRYYLRRRVPVQLVDHYGKQEILQSLGTADPATARRLVVQRWAALDQEFEKLLRPVSGDPVEHDLADISPTVVALADLDNLRARGVRAARDGTLAEFRQQCRDAVAMLDGMLDGKLPADDDLRVIEGRRNGLRAYLTGEGAMGLAVKRRVLVPESELSNRVRGLKTLEWSELVEKWAAERRPAAKTRNAHAAVAREFAEASGGKPVETLSKQQALAFKDALVARGVTPANLKTKLSRMRTLANFAYENDLVGVKAFQGIRVAKPKIKARLPFDDAALRALFGGPVHQDEDRPVQGRGEAAFWLPLIALYTGARLEEIAGLKVTDVRELAVLSTDGQEAVEPFLRFAPDPEEQSALKTMESERWTPIHPELIRIGLMAYAASVALGGHEQLFPGLTKHASGQRAHKWGSWFSSYLRATCGVSDSRMVFHSFRHTMKDAARAAGVPEAVQRQIMGHEGGDTADSYGLGYSPASMAEAMRSIRFPALPMIQRPSSVSRA